MPQLIIYCEQYLGEVEDNDKKVLFMQFLRARISKKASNQNIFTQVLKDNLFQKNTFSQLAQSNIWKFIINHVESPDALISLRQLEQYYPEEYLQVVSEISETSEVSETPEIPEEIRDM